jgi:hypothetical protein
MESLESKKNLKKSKLFVCEICDVVSSRKQDYDTHLLTAKHQRNHLETEKILTMPLESYHCIECNFTTLKKSLFEKHNNTIKHLQNMNKDTNKPTTYCCDNCNKEYLNRSGLYKHKKTCLVLENKTEFVNEFREPDMKKPEVTIDLVLDLIKQNKELQTVLIEQSKEHSKQIMELSKNQSVTNNNTNCNNTQFNLQLFLNETCKDAMNITDFVNSLQLTTQDFENTGKVGFIEGITQIIVNRLNSVDTTKRPMHCTDAKRETLYIKNDNVWEKEDDKKTKFRKVVNQVANKNLQQLNKWKDEHPDCIHLDTPENIDFRKYYRVALGGVSNEEDDKFFEKIKRNVLKEIVVDKSV